MANFIEEFFYGNLDPQARSTKQNKDVQKQMEILMNNEEKLTAALDDENKKLFLDFVIIPGLFEPPVRALRATIPESESRSKCIILLSIEYFLGNYL
ncbi:MAG: hypothetical protein J6C27_07060 [Clostridia bacterium]|nr:hypothetical protein [Clostridia bacterium]